MNVLITGSCGFLGSCLALLLRQKGHEVAGVDSFNSYYSPVIKRHTAAMLDREGIQVWELDLATHDLEPALQRVDAVVHCAAQPGISTITPWEDYHLNNIVATHRLVEAIRYSDAIRLINISTSSVYGLNAIGTEDTTPAPVSWYGVTKLAAEQEVMAVARTREISACSLRLFSIYGERERPEKLFPKLIRGLLNNEPLPLYEGSMEHRRSFTYVGDACRGIDRALDRWPDVDGEIFNLGSDLCFTTAEAIHVAEKITDRKIQTQLRPPRPGDQTATHANITKIKRVLGWQPETDLSTGLQRMIDWYRREIHGRMDWH